MCDPLPDADRRALVVGLGNVLRGDDGVGLAVARAVHERTPGPAVVETEGDPTRLLDVWADAELVVVVDAARGTGLPGTVTRIDVSRQRLPAQFFATSTHHVSLGETVELARALGVLPARTYLVAVEGGRFATGEGLSAEVAAAVPFAVEEVLRCMSGG